MKLILAADENWAIGKDGSLLCHLPGDLKFFKEKTTGKTIIMGRKTLESLPGGKPLPNRENIVLTRQLDYAKEGTYIIHSEKELEEILEMRNVDNVMIIGGGTLYQQFLDKCDTCFITKIYEKFEADTFFINLDEREDFEVIWKSEIKEENGIKYQFFEYKRIIGDTKQDGEEEVPVLEGN